MLKVIFYLVIIYFAYKLYKAFSQAKVIVKSFHYHDNRQQTGNQEEEGKVTIKENPAKGAGSQSSLNDGEYVDYEEVKD